MTDTQYTAIMERLDRIEAHLIAIQEYRKGQREHATRQRAPEVAKRIHQLQEVFLPTLTETAAIELTYAAEMLAALWEISPDNARQIIKRYAKRAGLKLEVSQAGTRYLYYLSLEPDQYGQEARKEQQPQEESEPYLSPDEPITPRNHSEISALLRAGLKRGDTPS